MIIRLVDVPNLEYYRPCDNKCGEAFKIHEWRTNEYFLICGPF